MPLCVAGTQMKAVRKGHTDVDVLDDIIERSKLLQMSDSIIPC